MLCIVEAMKLMNEIEAEFRCKIVKICKENAQPVEYMTTLFIVEKLYQTAFTGDISNVS